MMEEKDDSKTPFVSKIKNQLLSADIRSECCRNSFLCAVKVFSKSRKNAYSDAIEAYCEKLSKKKNKTFFDDGVKLGFYHSGERDNAEILSSNRVCSACFGHFLRGAFLTSGRASRTEKGLHIEIVMPNYNVAQFVREQLLSVGTPIDLKQTVRRGEILLYCKKKQTAEDLLSFIGAFSASFDIMNDTIVKGIRRSANRQKNCDATNVKRAVDAAVRQTEAIKAINANGGLKQLSPALRETACLRLENQFESLDELTELHSSEITRSGVNHRLQKIVRYAEKKGYLV